MSRRQPTCAVLLALTVVGSLAAQDPPASSWTIDDAVARVLSANRTIADAVDNVSRASASLSVVRSDFLPKLVPVVSWDDPNGLSGFTAGLNLSQKLPLGTQLTATPRITRRGEANGSAIDLTLTQSLTRGLSPSYNLAALKRAEFDARDAQRQLMLTKRQIVIQTIATVYDAMRRIETVRLEQASYDRLKQYEEAAVMKQRIGLASGIDVFRAGISAKQAESSLLVSRESYQDAIDALCLLLNLPQGTVVKVDAPVEGAPYEIAEPRAIATAIERRLDMQSLRDARTMAAVERSAARRRLLPEVDLLARFTSQKADVPAGGVPSLGGDRFMVGLTASSNLANVSDRAAFETSQLAISTLDRAIAVQSDQIALEVRYALRNKQRAELAIRLRQEELHQVRGKLELANVKFTHGMANNFDVIESESELRRAEIGLYSARVDATVATYSLKVAMGVLLDDAERLAK